MISTKRIASTGAEIWELPDGRRHREDGPAIIHPNGTTSWWLNGVRHRDGNLPAMEFAGGGAVWWVHGKRHRTDGPATIHMVFETATYKFFLDDKEYNIADYCAKLKSEFGVPIEVLSMMYMLYS